MPIFGISGKSLTPIKPVPFPSEKEIQIVTEQNLQVIFGFKFICSEFSLGQFRLDTIGFDEESKSLSVNNIGTSDFSPADNGER